MTERHGEPSDSPVKVGDIVDGRYSVSRYLARGGLSFVYEARETDTGEPVALKVARGAAGWELERRFSREASVFERVHDAHVPMLRGRGFVAGSIPYLVLELLEGTTLAERLRGGRLPSMPFAIEIAQQVLSALDAIHRAQVVHCDVKPANLFLHVRRRGSVLVKLIDFGICIKLGSATPEGIGNPGTPPYMSPEQIEGRSMDARTDLYSTGIVLYEMLSGRLPFAASTPELTAEAVLRADVLPLRALRPACPVELEGLVMKAISRRPEHRYKGAHEMLVELSAVGAMMAKAGRASAGDDQEPVQLSRSARS